MKLNYTVGDSNWTQKNYTGSRFSDSVLEKPIVTDGNIKNTDNKSSLMNYERENSNQTLLMQTQSSTPGTTFEVETSSSQAQTTFILSWAPTQESSSFTTISDDNDHTSIGNGMDKTNFSQVESNINNLDLVSTSNDSSVLNLETLVWDVKNDSLNEKTNKSGLEKTSSNKKITLNGTLFNKSNDDNVTRVTNKTATLSDRVVSTPLPKAPLQVRQDLSSTEKNMKSDGKIELSNTTFLNETVVGRSSDKTEMNKQKVLTNETNLNTYTNHAKLKVRVDNNDVSQPPPKKVDSGDIKNRNGNFEGSSLNISKSVYRKLDKSLLEPAIKVMNSTDSMLKKTSNSSKEVVLSSELGLAVQSLTEPPRNSLLKSTTYEPKKVNDQVDVTSNLKGIGSGLNNSLRHSPIHKSTITKKNGTVHNRCLILQKPVDTSGEIMNLLQDSLAQNHIFGNKRNVGNPTHTNSLNANTDEQKVSTDFESKDILSSENESNSKHIFTGMNHLPFGSMKLPKNFYPIQVVDPSTIFKQTLIEKLYTFYRGKLYLLVPVPRYGRTTLKNDGVRLTNSHERLQKIEGGLPGQYNDKHTEQKSSIYPFTDQNLLEQINLDQPKNLAYYGIYDEFQQSQHQIYDKPNSHNARENLNNRVDRYGDNLQRNPYARTQQRQNLSYTKPIPLFVNSNEINMDHTSSPLQVDIDYIFPDINTNNPSLEQSYFSQKPSEYEKIMPSPNYIQPSLISSIQKQSLYSNYKNPYVSSSNSLTKESNTNHQPYHSFDSTIEPQISSSDFLSFLLSLYKQRRSLGKSKSMGIFNKVIHPKQELFSYPQESTFRVTANDPIITQFPMNSKTTFQGQLRNNDLLSNPLIPENYQLHINEPIKVSNRGQVPTVYSRIPRLATNKANNREKLAQNYYDTERNYMLQPTSDIPHVISRNENLLSNQNAPISAPTNNPYIINYSQNTGKERSQGSNPKHVINSVEDQLAQDSVSPLPNKLVNDNLLGTITSELNQIIDQLSTLENHPEALYGRDFSQSQPYVSHAKDVGLHTFETPDQHFNYPFPYQQSANRISVAKKQPETFHQPPENLILLEQSRSNENSNIENSRRPTKNHQPFHNVMLNDVSQLYEKTNVENGGRPTKMHHSFESLISKEESHPYETSNSEQHIKTHQPLEKYILTEGSQSDENSNVGNNGQPINSNQPIENVIFNKRFQNYENSNIENNRRSINLHQQLENSILKDGSQPYENSKVENSRRPFSPYQQLEMSILNKGSQPYQNPNVENSRPAVKTNQPFENFILNEGSQTYETSNIENSRRPFNPSQQLEKYIFNEGSKPFENSNVENSRRTVKTNQPFENLILNEESQTYGKSNIENDRRPINLYQPFEKSTLNEGSQPYENFNVDNSRQTVINNQQFENVILNEESQTNRKSNFENGRRPINFYQTFGKSTLNEGSQLYENSLSNHNTGLHSGPSYSSWSDHIDTFEPLSRRQELSTSSFLNHLNNGYYQRTSPGRQYLPPQNGYHSTSGAQYSAADPAEPNNSPQIDIYNKSPSHSFDQNQHQTPLYTVPKENLYSYQIPNFVSPYLNTDPNTQYSFDRSQRLQRTYDYGQTNKMPSFPGASHIKRKTDVNSGGTTKTLLENSATNPLNVRSIDWKKYKRPGKKATNLNRNLDRTFSPVSSQDLKTTQTKAEFENPDLLISDPNVSKPPSRVFQTKEPVRSDHTSGKLTNTDKGIVTANEFTNEQLMSSGKHEIPNRDVVNNNIMYNPQQEQQFTGSIDSFNPMPATELGSIIPSDRYNNYGQYHENLNRFQSMDSSNSQNPLYNSDGTPESSSSKYIKGYNIQPKFVSQHHHVSEGSRVEAQYGQPFSYPMFSKLNTPTQINHNYYNRPLGRDLQNLNIEPNVPQNFHRIHNNHYFRKTNTPIRINTNGNIRQLVSRDDSLNGVNVPSSTGSQLPQTMQSDVHFTYSNQPNPKRPFYLENPQNARRHYHNSFNSQSQTIQLPQPTWQDGNKWFSIENAAHQRHVNQFHKQPVSENNHVNGFGKDSFERLPHTVREDSSRYTSQMNEHSAGNTGYSESQQNNINNPIELNQPSSQYSLKPTYSFNAEPSETNHFHNGFETNGPQSVVGSSYNGNKEKYISYSGSNIQNQPLVLQHGRSQRSQRYHVMNHLGSSQFEHRNGYYTNIINHNNPINVQQYPLSYYQEINHRQSMSHTSPDTRHIYSNLTLDFDQANKNRLYKRTHQLNALESNVNGLHSARGESYNQNANYKYVNYPTLHTLQPPASNFGKTIDKSILSNSFSSQTSNVDGILDGYRLYPKPVNVHSPFSEVHSSLVSKGNNMNVNINTGSQTNPIVNPALNSHFPEPSSSDNGNIYNDEINNGFQSNPSQKNVKPILNSRFPDVQHLSSDSGDNSKNNGYQLNPSQNDVNPALNSPLSEIQSASGFKGNNIDDNLNNGFQSNPSQNNVNSILNSPFPEIQSSSGDKDNNIIKDNNNYRLQFNPSQHNVNPASHFPSPGLQSASGVKSNHINDNINNGFQLNHSQNNINHGSNFSFHEIQSTSGGKLTNMDDNINNVHTLIPSQNNINPAFNSPFPVNNPASGGEGNNVNVNFRNEFNSHSRPLNVSPALNSPYPEIQPASGDKRSIDNTNNRFQLNPSQNNVNPALNSPLPEIQPSLGVEVNNNIDANNGFWNVNKSLEQYTSMNKSNGVADEVDELSEDLSKIFQKRIARLNKLSERLSAPIVINDFSQNRITSRNGALLELQNKTKNGKAENGPKYDKDNQISNENLTSSHSIQTNINSSAESTSVQQEGCLINGTLMEVGEEWTVAGVCGVYTCQSSGVRVLDSTCPKLKLKEDQLCEIEKADNDLEFPLCCPTLKCKPKIETRKNSTSHHAS